MNSRKHAIEALASSDLFADVCPKSSVIVRAMKWREDHADHVGMLEDAATHCFPPSDEDFPRPELWKSGSWKWLREFFPENG